MKENADSGLDKTRPHVFGRLGFVMMASLFGGASHDSMKKRIQDAMPYGAAALLFICGNLTPNASMGVRIVGLTCAIFCVVAVCVIAYER